MSRYHPLYSKTSIFRHSKLALGEAKVDGRINNKSAGRKRKLKSRDHRAIVTSLLKLRTTEGNFHSTDVQKDAGLEGEVSNRTVRRCLRTQGYRFTQCRKKGQLTTQDLKLRLAFARKCKKLLSVS